MGVLIEAGVERVVLDDEPMVALLAHLDRARGENGAEAVRLAKTLRDGQLTRSSVVLDETAAAVLFTALEDVRRELRLSIELRSAFRELV